MDASTILSGYGLAGLVIFTLASVTIVLYRDNQKLQEKLITAQQNRVDDAKEVNEKITVPLELIARTNDLIYRKLYDAKKES